MKNVKVFLFIFGLGFLISNSTILFAEENTQNDDQVLHAPDQGQGNAPQNQMPEGENATQNRGPGGRPPMMGGGMGGGGKDSMVATSDGGVVIMQGPRILKYDKDLTLIKEVELPRGKKPGRNNAPIKKQNEAPSDQEVEAAAPATTPSPSAE